MLSPQAAAEDRPLRVLGAFPGSLCLPGRGSSLAAGAAAADEEEGVGLAGRGWGFGEALTERAVNGCADVLEEYRRAGGSVVTRDVPENKLALGRSRQKNIKRK